MSSDRVEKKILLRAPRQRVWRALADSGEFGTWFGIRFDGPFTPGARVTGVLVGTQADPEVAKAQKQHQGLRIEITIERMEPERVFSLRWHPFAIDPKVDYSAEPTTLVEFVLNEAPDGVLLTVTESGFDQIPLARRAQAFEANEGGWAVMVQVLGAHLVQNP
ncbi:MAG TPA: SRPBCC family protein [Terriglobia bacterium]|nr:SRPBCC family protein [Terriglobia bacterium]